MSPFKYCKVGGKVTFTTPFLILGNMTFDEMSCRCDISNTLN